MGGRRRADDVYDDDDLTGAAEARAWADAPRRTPWPKTPDELDCRWAPYGAGRGWLSVRDPFTGERVEVATKYVEGAPWQAIPKGVPAPQEWVRRAMEKLPPKRKDRP
jgi:hypothetical protein